MNRHLFFFNNGKSSYGWCNIKCNGWRLKTNNLRLQLSVHYSYPRLKLGLRSVHIHILGSNWWGAFYENKIVIFSFTIDNLLVNKRIDVVFLHVIDGLVAVLETNINLPQKNNWYSTHYKPNMDALQTCWRLVHVSL